jgi:hypothetical protein
MPNPCRRGDGGDPVKDWMDYTVGEIDRGVQEIDRATGIVELADLYSNRTHWLIGCPPDGLKDFATHLTPALCEHAIFYADGGVATLMKISIPLGGMMLSASSATIRLTLVVALPKEWVTQEHIERFFGEHIPEGLARHDVILLRDGSDKVPYPTMLLDAIMLADPHTGQEIIDSAAGEAS